MSGKQYNTTHNIKYRKQDGKNGIPDFYSTSTQPSNIILLNIT